MIDHPPAPITVFVQKLKPSAILLLAAALRVWLAEPTHASPHLLDRQTRDAGQVRASHIYVAIAIGQGKDNWP